jgi:hypothetical protein
MAGTGGTLKANYRTMKAETIQALNDGFEKHPVTVAGCVPRPEVDTLEKQIGFRLPEDYKEFVTRYGGGIVGSFSIFGLRAAHAMAVAEASALEVTHRFRKFDWEGTSNWLIVSMDLSGNPIGLDPRGKVWISDHDAGGVRELAPNFEEYLRKWCLKLDSAF